MKSNLTITIDSTFASSNCVGVCTVSAKEDHPNKTLFKGTLLIVDEPSNRPPNGSEGHRILVPKKIAEKNLDSLIGMGLNYQPNKLSGHMPRHKVGVITGAWIDGNKVQVTGHIFSKDFPEAAKELKGSNIGMSMELANVLVKNKSDPIWKLIDFSFTGATALYKNSAAYNKTSLSAAAERELQYLLTGDNVMSDKSKKKKAALSGSSKQLGNLVTAIGESVRNGIKEGLRPFGKKIEQISASVEEQGKTVTDYISLQTKEKIEAGADSDKDESSEADSVHASADESVDVDEDESDELTAAGDDDADDMKGKGKGLTKVKAKKADDDDDTDDSSSDGDDSSDVDAALEKLSKGAANGTKAGPDDESSNPELGSLNKNAKSKRNKTSVNASVVKHVREISAAAHKRIDNLKKENKKLRKTIHAGTRKHKELETTVEEMQAQIEEFTANNIGPKALPPATVMLLSKSGYDLNELNASGRKLTVSEVDEMLASAGVSLNPTERMTMKNNLLEKGLMEQGEINRLQ